MVFNILWNDNKTFSDKLGVLDSYKTYLRYLEYFRIFLCNELLIPEQFRLLWFISSQSRSTKASYLYTKTVIVKKLKTPIC